MTEWKSTIQIKDIIINTIGEEQKNYPNDEEIPTEVVQLIAGRVAERIADFIDDKNDLPEDLVGQLRDVMEDFTILSDDPDTNNYMFDGAIDSLYDICDDYQIWVD